MEPAKEKIAYIIFVRGASLEYFFNPHTANGEWIEYSLKKSLEEMGYTVKFSASGENLEPFDVLISFEVDPEILRNLAAYPKEKCMLIIFEPPHVAPIFYAKETQARFAKNLIFYEMPEDATNYIRFYMPFMEKSLKKPEQIPSFEEKKFCVGIQGNKYFHHHPDELYTERKKAFNFFTTTGEFEIYGMNWQGNPCWKGMAPEPLNETFKNYKFSLIFENWKNHKGYITERLFAGMSSRSVPAYWGASDITDYVPEDCFIDLRKFANYQEVYQFMKTMSKETYQKYIDAIDAFFACKTNLDKFTKENWIKMVLSHLPK